MKTINERYVIENYQNKKTFSSFLSGIAGLTGVPIWSFYVNRGQAITSFGTRDKNGAIMEFFPANAAYMYTKKIGFRTFVKVDNKVYEFFNKSNDTQKMIITQDQLRLEEYNKELKLKVVVVYFTLPNERNGGLVRKVSIINEGTPRDIVIVDGIAQILPAGIDYGGYKAVSNLLQSWMQVDEKYSSLFFKLRASTDDSSEVSLVVDGNYYYTTAKNIEKINYIYDYKVIFGNDSSFEYPEGLEQFTFEELLQQKQVDVNQVPSAFTIFTTKIKKEVSFVSLIGYTSDDSFLEKISKDFTYEYLSNKEFENKKLHNNLLAAIETKTSSKLLDSYYRQNFLDNVLRGGIPLVFETKNGPIGYHVYSRKHGDLERDYNFFVIEPKYFSQGNGNFRDVLQNRRNDLLFVPEIKDSNLYQFASLIQADGYNPLSIEGLKFTYQGKKKYSPEIDKLLKNEFTPGDLSMLLEDFNFEIMPTLKEILKESVVVVKASYGEGYWEDHFTYLDDVIASVEELYPDEIEEIVFENNNYAFYDSGVYVKPRSEKYVLTKENKVRQYDSVKHLHKKTDWLVDTNGDQLKVNLIGKLITLSLNKYAHLDPEGIGLSYEANKPGWNDAMNGLPGLFASGVSETIELLKIVKRTLRYLSEYPNQDVLLINLTQKLSNVLLNIIAENDFDFWNQRMNAIEQYRRDLFEQNLTTEKYKAFDFIEVFEKIKNVLENAVTKAKKLATIIPTYLVYEAIEYTELQKTNERNEQLVTVNKFVRRELPTFLEGPTRLLKTIQDPLHAKQIYETIKKSELYDSDLKFYKTSIDLSNETPEIGRIHAFTKGWLERESNFLHMTYKYLLSLLNAELYDEFYEEIKTNYTCFMDPEIYGRSPIENSSFIAPSNNPDYRKRGQGFVSRLSGSTSEMLSMWKQMFFGKKLFDIENGELVFKISPRLNKSLFDKKEVRTRLFSNTEVIIYNENMINTYDKNAKVAKIVLEDENGVEKIFEGNKVFGKWASKIRQKSIYKIKVYILKEEKK